MRTKKKDLLSRLVTPTGTKGCASHVALAAPFVLTPPFVPAWRSRLGNQDNRGFPTGTNQCFCSSDWSAPKKSGCCYKSFL